MQAKENLLDIFRALYKRRKSIIWLTIITTLLVTVISLTLPNWYMGATTFYVASPDLAKPSPVGMSGSEKEYYGEGEDIDRMLTIANGSQVANAMIKQFDLMNHYEIDTTNEKSSVKALKKFNKHYNVIKTQYEALQLTFESTNQFLARDVTNNARDKINEIAQRLIKDSQKKEMVTFEQNITEKERTLQLLNTKLDSIRSLYEIYDSRQQGQIIAEILSKSSIKIENSKAKYKLYSSLGGRYVDSTRLYEASIAGYKNQIAMAKKQADNFNKGVSLVTDLQSQAAEASTQLALDKERYKSLKSMYLTDFDAVHVVEFASKPVEKSRPVRSILILSAGFLAFCFFCLIAILTEFYKNIDWKSIKNE